MPFTDVLPKTANPSPTSFRYEPLTIFPNQPPSKFGLSGYNKIGCDQFTTSLLGVQYANPIHAILLTQSHNLIFVRWLFG